MISKHETVNDSTASFALALKIGFFFFLTAKIDKTVS